MVPEAPHTMALAAQRIQDQAVLAMPVPVGPVTQVRVERVKTVLGLQISAGGDASSSQRDARQPKL